MIAEVLSAWLRRMKRRAEASCVVPVHVDRIELNHYWWATGCESHQVILWRWSQQEARFLAQRFFFVSDADELPQRVNGRWRFIYRTKTQTGTLRVFETNDLIETVTAHDPWLRARAS